MERVAERLASAKSALATLKAVKKKRVSAEDARDLRILRFTYTFEAVWKAAQALLAEEHATQLASPKLVIRAIGDFGLLSVDDAAWALKMANDRNLAAQVYNEELALGLNSRIDDHIALLSRWLKAMQASMGGRR